MQPMPRKLPLNVVRERSRHGRVMFFYRKGKGPRIRLPDAFPSPEFNAAYAAIISGQAPAAPRRRSTPAGTLRWLIERYKESALWATYSPSTRRQRDLIFVDTIERANNPPFAEITRRHMQQALDDRAATPAQANSFLKAMRGLFDWAVKADYLETSPCAGVDRLTYRSDGFPAWTIEDAQAFCARWPVGTMPRLAFELYLTSGVRRGDMHVAGRQHLRGNVFAMKTQKTGVEITVVLPDRLLATIAATKTGALHFIVKDNGQPFASKESFGNWFGDRCRDAGIAKSAHGIRKLAATLAADAGNSTHELMAHFGWLKVDQAEIYTKGADRKRLGMESSRRVADQVENILPRTAAPGSGKAPNKAAKSRLK